MRTRSIDRALPIRASNSMSAAQNTVGPEATSKRFGDLVAAAAKPIDDIRGLAAYRRHALAVMARRCLAWAWAA